MLLYICGEREREGKRAKKGLANIMWKCRSVNGMEWKGKGSSHGRMCMFLECSLLILSFDVIGLLYFSHYFSSPLSFLIPPKVSILLRYNN